MQNQSCKRCSSKSAATLYTKEYDKPKTVKKSESYMSKKFEELYNQSFKWTNKRKKICQDKSEQKAKEQLQGCTFKPAINSNEDYFVTNDPFLKRQMDWKNSIEKKILSQREQKQKQQKSSLSFKPKISPSPNLIKSTLQKTTSNKEKNNTINSYNSRLYCQQKKSYRLIHAEHKKFKELAKSTIIEPFKHRITQDETKQQDKALFKNQIETVNFKKGRTLKVKFSEKNNLILTNQKEQNQNNPEKPDRAENQQKVIPEYMCKSIEVKIVEEEQEKIQIEQNEENICLKEQESNISTKFSQLKTEQEQTLQNKNNLTQNCEVII